MSSGGVTGGLLAIQSAMGEGLGAIRGRRDLADMAEAAAYQFQLIPTPESLNVAQMIRANPMAAKQVADQFGGFDKLHAIMQQRFYQTAQGEAISQNPDLVRRLTEQPQGESGAFDDLLQRGVAAGLPPDQILKLAQDLQGAARQPESRRPLQVGRFVLDPRDPSKVLFEAPPEETGERISFDAQGRPIIERGSAIGSRQFQEAAADRAQQTGALSQLVDAINVLDASPGQIAGGRGAAANLLSGIAGIALGTEAGDTTARWLTGDPNVTAAELETVQRGLRGIAIANRDQILADRGSKLSDREQQLLDDAVGVASSGLSLRNQDQVKASLRRILGLRFTSDEVARVIRGEPPRFDIVPHDTSQAEMERAQQAIIDARDRLVSEIGISPADAHILLRGLEDELGRAGALRAIPEVR